MVGETRMVGRRGCSLHPLQGRWRQVPMIWVRPVLWLIQKDLHTLRLNRSSHRPTKRWTGTSLSHR